MRKFSAMFKARTMEFVRDRGTFFWNLLFPVVLVFGFAFAFSGDQNQLFKVGVIGQAEETLPFMQIEQIEFVQYDQEEDTQSVIERLRQHQLDMVLDFTDNEYYINTESANGPVLRMLFRANREAGASASAVGPGPTAGARASAGSAGREDRDGAGTTSERAGREGQDRVASSGTAGPGGQPSGAAAAGPSGQTATARTVSMQNPAVGDSPAGQFTERQVSGEPIRYVDWLVPGVIGMNMMFSCLFGVGFVIVRYRKNGVLKRLKATPVSALNFVSAQAASRLVIVIVTSIVVFGGTNLFLNFMMKGSYLNLLLVTALAIICMISVGLVFASRLKSEELASGLMNLVTFPMLILSGVFFSLEGSPRVLQQVSKALPLTHFVDGARAIMLEGAGLVEILPNLLFLAALTVAFLMLSAFLFRWE